MASYTTSHWNGFTYLHCADGRVLQVPSGGALDDHDLVALEPAGRELTTFSPPDLRDARGARGAAKLAARLGDIKKLRQAVEEKLDEEAAFAAHVKATFAGGGQRGNKNAKKNDGARSCAVVSLGDYCRGLGSPSARCKVGTSSSTTRP